MFFGKRKIRIRKYRKKVLDIYEPVKRIELNKGDAVPILLRIGGWFLFLGGWISFFVSGLVMGVRGFFGVRKRARKVFDGDVVEIKKKKVYK